MDGTPWLMKSEKSSLAVAGDGQHVLVAQRSLEQPDRAIDQRRVIDHGVRTLGQLDLGAGAPDMAACALALRSMPSCSLLRTSLL